MGFIELFLLGVGLSMDAFAVSVCKGLAMKKATLKSQMTCGLWFGGFQALMPLIGFFLGAMFADAIKSFDHWIAFGLLALIGANMLKEALEKECDCCEEHDADMSVKTMFYFNRRTGGWHFSGHGRRCEHLGSHCADRCYHLRPVCSGREDWQYLWQPL